MRILILHDIIRSVRYYLICQRVNRKFQINNSMPGTIWKFRQNWAELGLDAAFPKPEATEWPKRLPNWPLNRKLHLGGEGQNGLAA